MAGNERKKIGHRGQSSGHVGGGVQVRGQGWQERQGRDRIECRAERKTEV